MNSSQSVQESIKRILARKDIVISIGIILLGLWGANYLYQKQQQKLKRIEDEITLQEQKIALANELTELGGKLKTISSPYIKQAASFTMNKFHEFASSADVKIATIAVENEVDSGLYTVMNYRLSLKSDYNNLKKFISLLESQADMVRVEELSIERGQVRARKAKVAEEKNILNISIRVSAAFIKSL